MSYTYDDQNVFAKILRGEIPSKPIFESDHTIAFPDIAPQKTAHILVIPRGPYRCFDHFTQAASTEEQIDFYRSVAEVAKLVGVSEAHGGQGFRLVTNSGENGHQEVPHYHVHILGGEPVGPMVSS